MHKHATARADTPTVPVNRQPARGGAAAPAEMPPTADCHPTDTEVPGSDQPWGGRSDHAWNDEPQPQVPDTFGLPNLKPEPLAPST